MRQLLSEIKAGPLGMATASRVEAWVSVMVHRSSDDEVGITRHERSVLDSAFACRASQMSTQEYMLRARGWITLSRAWLQSKKQRCRVLLFDDGPYYLPSPQQASALMEFERAHLAAFRAREKGSEGSDRNAEAFAYSMYVVPKPIWEAMPNR
jgi:hypothetical protein